MKEAFRIKNDNMNDSEKRPEVSTNNLDRRKFEENFSRNIKASIDRYSREKDVAWHEIGSATDNYIINISKSRDYFSTILSSIIQKRYETVIEQKQQDHKNLTDKIKYKMFTRYVGGIVSVASGALTIAGGLHVALPASSICCVGVGASLIAGSACMLVGRHLCDSANVIGNYSFADELSSIKTAINKLQQDITETGDKPHNDTGQNGHTNFHNRFHIVYKLNDLQKRCHALYNILDDLAADDSIEMTKDDVVELLEHLFEIHSVEDKFEITNNNVADTNLNNSVKSEDIKKNNIE